MYEFLTGSPPTTTAVILELGVSVSGRAVFFPQNQGYAGSTLEVWQVESATGQRMGDAALATFAIGETGAWGPVELSSSNQYEFALRRPANEAVLVETVHHFYPEAFKHSNQFFRLQSSAPGGSIEGFLPATETFTGMVVTRQREFWGDQDSLSDELLINGLNVLDANISPRTGVNLAVFVFDHEADGVTDLTKGEVSPFDVITFLTGADVSIAATPDGSGVISVELVTRGGTETEMNIPNWPSATNRISVMFNDDTQ
jgi:hypothetical protein